MAKTGMVGKSGMKDTGPMKKKSTPFSSPLTSSYVNESKGDGSKKRSETRVKRKKKGKKQSKRSRQEDEEEARLTELLFGADSSATGGSDNDHEKAAEDRAFLEGFEKKERLGTGVSGDGLFEIDRNGVPAEAAQVGAIEGGKSDDVIVKQGAAAWNDDEEEESSDKDDDDVNLKVAWKDDDEDDAGGGAVVSLLSRNRTRKLRHSRAEAGTLTAGEYEDRLRNRFQTTASALARTDWADVSMATGEKRRRPASDEEPSSDEEEGAGKSVTAHSLLHSTESLLSSHTDILPPSILSVVRCPNANQHDPNKSAVNAVQFHAGSEEDTPLMLTAGMDKALRFFRIDGEGNQKVHGIHFPKFPIYSASFLGLTGNVIVSSRRPFFYIYDAVAGKVDKVPSIFGRTERSLEKFTTSPDGRIIAFIGNDGYIILVDAKSKQWVGDLKMNGSARAVTFTPDGEFIIASGSDGEVYRWNVQSRRCVDRFQNEDGTITSYLTASSNFLAVGAESGVVNLFREEDRSSSHSGAPVNFSARRPIKSIMNLHTSSDFLKFNGDGQILAMSTRREIDTLKLLHVPTATVFSNWPTSKTPLGYVWSMDFSPGSKYMAIGNDKGKCLLYRLKHYEDN